MSLPTANQRQPIAKGLASLQTRLASKRATSQSGFTLLETLVAVSLLALAVAGPLYVASRAYVATQIARDHLTASYLAQEGIEYVRSMRDHEFLEAYDSDPGEASDNAWKAFVSGINQHGGSITGCQVSGANPNQACTLNPFAVLMGNALVPCSGTCGPLYLVGGRYLQSGTVSQRTPFTRKIQALYDPGPGGAPNVIRIASIVTWTNRGTPYTVTVAVNLTPWQ